MLIRLNTKLISGKIGELKILNILELAVKLPPPIYLNKSKLFKGRYLIILLEETNKLSMAVAKKQKIDTVTAPT